MTSSERREKICALLKQLEEPISAAQLAKKYNVSRQIIVGDIALLRASGLDILATPKGYIILPPDNDLQFIIACKHNKEEMTDEIYTIIDLGGKIRNVIIEHPVYGQLVGEMHISNRYDAQCFIEKLDNEETPMLSSLTDGLHLHTITCPDEQTYHRILDVLHEKNILLTKN